MLTPAVTFLVNPCLFFNEEQTVNKFWDICDGLVSYSRVLLSTLSCSGSGLIRSACLGQ